MQLTNSIRALTSLWDHSLVGLDIGVSAIKAVQLTDGSDKRLLAYNRLPLPRNTISSDGEIKDRETIVTALKKLFATKSFTSKRVAIGLFGNSVIIKKISLPKMSRKELSDQLFWEAEQYIPFDINEVNLDFAILGPSASGGAATSMMDVLIVAAKKDYIQDLSSILAEADLELVVVESQAFSLGNAYEFNYAQDGQSVGSVAIVDVGAGSAKVSIVVNNMTIFSRELRMSGDQCTQRIADGLTVSFEEAERKKIAESESSDVESHLKVFNSQFIDELQRTFDFFLSQSTDKAIDKIFLCGGASRTQGLIESLQQTIATPFEVLNPVQKIAGSGIEVEEARIDDLTTLGAVALGLSLRSTHENL